MPDIKFQESNVRDEIIKTVIRRDVENNTKEKDTHIVRWVKRVHLCEGIIN